MRSTVRSLRIAKVRKRLDTGLSRYSVSKVKIWTAHRAWPDLPAAAIVLGPPGD
jgi:hypothetical protein